MHGGEIAVHGDGGWQQQRREKAEEKEEVRPGEKNEEGKKKGEKRCLWARP